MRRASRFRRALDLFSSLAMIVASAVLVWAVFSTRGQQPAFPVNANSPPLPTEPIAISTDFAAGDKNANVVIVEFSDFECPYCQKAARDTLPSVLGGAVRRGDALFVFRHLPLAIHRNSRPLAEAAVCAGRLGKFWEMHDALFAPTFPPAARLNISDVAHSVGIDSSRFTQCLGTTDAKSIVDRDLAEAERLQITGTPTFLIGRRLANGRVRVTERVTGAVPPATLDALIAKVQAAH